MVTILVALFRFVSVKNNYRTSVVIVCIHLTFILCVSLQFGVQIAARQKWQKSKNKYSGLQ